MTDRTDIDEQKLKARLLARRAELESVADTVHDATRPVELDQSRVGRLSRMDALQGQAMAQETERRHEVELKRIARALELMDEGEYGYCTACGSAIAAGRMELDPATLICIDCARGAH